MTVLLVEPESLLRDYLRRQLAGVFEVLEASGPADAIDICRTHLDIDLLICDVDLGLVSGMELASLLRAWIPTVKTVLLSDLSPDLWSERQRSEWSELPQDAVQVVRNPFSAQELSTALSQLANGVAAGTRWASSVKV